MDPHSRGEHRISRKHSSSNLFFLVCLCLAELLLQLNCVRADGYSAMAESQALRNDASPESKIQKLDLMNPFSSEQEIDYKRSSSFFPLRGKKPSLAATYVPSHYPIIYEQEETSSEDKRSHFYPLRGKKVPTDLKRASYFMPMRGRKDDEEAWWDDNEKRMSSFMPMRGKKRMVDSFQNLGKTGTYNSEIKQFPSSDSSTHSSVLLPQDDGGSVLEKLMNKTIAKKQKRSVGFVPMRGKRSISEDTSEIGKDEITAQIYRDYFGVMRQRRHSQDKEDNINYLLSLAYGKNIGENYDNQSDIKHVDGNGKNSPFFMPLRGRRDTHSFKDRIEKDKRKFSFTPMRGRRDSDNQRSDMHNDDNMFSAEVKDDWTSYLQDSQLHNSNAGKHNSQFSQLERGASSFRHLRESDYHKTPMDKNNFLSVSHPSPFLSFQDPMTKSLDDKKAAKASYFFPMRGRASPSNNETLNFDKRGFMAMRGRRRGMSDSNDYFFHTYPYFVPPGIGSSLMTRQFSRGVVPIRTASYKTRKLDWDSVKRAFHATRGKRYRAEGIDKRQDMEPSQQESGEGCRCKRSVRTQVVQSPRQQYLALKRPMSFFATRGKRPDPALAENH